MRDVVQGKRGRDAERGSGGRVDQRTRAARARGRNARQALLSAAAEVFAERGYRDASVDEIAERAGYSKGALYWHFRSKDNLFLALLDDRLDRPAREMRDLLESAPPEQDMGPEASRRFVELLRSERELLLLEQEYWSQAARDPLLLDRWVVRQTRLRAALAKALQVRVEHLGGPPVSRSRSEAMATVIMGLSAGLARERLIDPEAVPDTLLGEAIVLLYKGLVAGAAEREG